MKIFLLLLLVTSLSNGATGATLVALDTTYTLPLTLTLGREIKPFDEYLLAATNVRISKVSMGTGKSVTYLQNDTARSIFSGKCSVAAVTEDGQEAIKNVDVRNAQARYKGETRDIIPTGALVKAQFSDSGNVYTVKDDTLSPDITADLSGLIRSEGGLKSGFIMNPKHPVSPGDVWSIDTLAFASTLGPAPTNSPRRVVGTVRFVRIDTVDQLPCAVVNMDARAENAFAELEGMPTQRSTVTAHIELTVPLDLRLPAVRVLSTTNISADVGDAGQIIHFDFENSDEILFRR